MTTASEKEIDFSVFLLHRLAERFNRSAYNVFNQLEQTGVFEDYIIPYYDTLHTLGEEYLVNDVIAYAAKRGVVL